MNERVREEVQAALALTSEVPERTCPACGRTERTRGEHCPHCGYGYFDRPPAEVRKRRIALLATIGLLLAAAVAFVVIQSGDSSKRNRKAAAERQRLVAAEIRHLRRVQAPHRASAPQLLAALRSTDDAVRLRARHNLLLAAQDAITTDARRRATTGELTGPIDHTECGPLSHSPDAVTDDTVLTKPIGRYDCVASKADVKQDGKTVAHLGYAYVTALHFRDASFVYCRNTPAQSEAGKALVHVRLERACLAATGEAVGNGYVDTGD